MIGIMREGSDGVVLHHGLNGCALTVLHDSNHVGQVRLAVDQETQTIHLNADRLSCTQFKANEFRLLLHTFARALPGQSWLLAAASVDTLKLKVLKIAAQVVQSVRRTLFTMPKAYQRLFATAPRNIQRMPLRC